MVTGNEHLKARAPRFAQARFFQYAKGRAFRLHPVPPRLAFCRR